MFRKSSWLSNGEYDFVIKKLPIPTVDLVILRKLSRKWEVLLLIRKTGYEKGNWCIIGGRVLKGEMIKDTVKRQAADLGIQVKIIAPFDYNFPVLVNDHQNQDKTKQPLCCVYPVTITSGEVRDEGEEYKGFKWYSVSKLPSLAYDHRFEVLETLRRLSKYGKK